MNSSSQLSNLGFLCASKLYNKVNECKYISFPLPEGGEEIRSAPFAYILDLGRRIQMLLDENERYTLLTCTLLKIYICTNLQAGAVNLA